MVMNVADPLRNRASFVHPTNALPTIPEALLLLNTAKTILHYRGREASSDGAGLRRSGEEVK
jgi:hypothetical protein